MSVRTCFTKVCDQTDLLSLSNFAAHFARIFVVVGFVPLSSISRHICFYFIKCSFVVVFPFPPGPVYHSVNTCEYTLW